MTYWHLKDDGLCRRVLLSEREDGYIISTVRSHDNWYGPYETAFWLKGWGNVQILKGYSTEEQAIQGHLEFCGMSTEELEDYETIG